MAGGGDLSVGRRPESTKEKEEEDMPELSCMGGDCFLVLCCFLILTRFFLKPSTGSIFHRKASSQVLRFGDVDITDLMLEELMPLWYHFDQMDTFFFVIVKTSFLFNVDIMKMSVL